MPQREGSIIFFVSEAGQKFSLKDDYRLQQPSAENKSCQETQSILTESVVILTQ